MQPQEAIFLFQAVLLRAFIEEHGITKRIIEAVPSNKLDYRPHPADRSAFELARHIVATEKRLMDFAASGEFNRGTVLPENIHNQQDLIRWYSENFNTCLDKTKQLSGEDLAKTLQFIRGALPAVMCLQFTLNHSIHHRGQLAAYLRSMGARVPSIYGESFDDAEARKAAQAQN